MAIAAAAPVVGHLERELGDGRVVVRPDEPGRADAVDGMRRADRPREVPEVVEVGEVVDEHRARLHRGEEAAVPPLVGLAGDRGGELVAVPCEQRAQPDVGAVAERAPTGRAISASRWVARSTSRSMTPGIATSASNAATSPRTAVDVGRTR